jgi:hypothetical protein
MRLPFASVMLFLFCISSHVAAYSQNPTRARTEDGKEVLLFPDGTWKYAGTPEASSSPTSIPVERKSRLATTEFKTQKGQFSIWVNTAKWQQDHGPVSGPTEFKFTHKNGDGYAMVIPERITMPLDSLKEIVLDIAKRAAPDAKIISEQMKVVNGQKILAMKMEGTIRGIPFVYYGYYYAGEAGTLQVVAYTGKSLFKEYEQEFTEFLNGVVIHSPTR